MNFQVILVAIVFLAAAGYLARQAWRTWSGSGCSGGCCKSGAAAGEKKGLIPAEELLGACDNAPGRGTVEGGLSFLVYRFALFREERARNGETRQSSPHESRMNSAA